MATPASKPKRGGKYCVAGGPNGASCKNSSFTEGISMHLFPKVKNKGAEADKEKAKTRRVWIQFVQRHRRDFQASATSVLCSAHFEPSCFSQNLEIAGSLGFRKRLEPGAVPTIDIAGLPTQTAPATTEREHRRVLREALREVSASQSVESPSVEDGNEHASEQQGGESGHEMVGETELDPPTRNCDGCEDLKRKIRGLQKTISRLKKRTRDQDNQTDKDDSEMEDDPEDTDSPLDAPSSPCEEEEEEEELLETDDEEYEVDTDYSHEESSAADSPSDEDEVDDGGSRANIVTVEPGTHCLDEPKFLVFFRMLTTIFSLFCFNCKRDNPTVTVKKNGTMAIVTQNCTSCGEDSFTWRSQPYILGTYPAGNILISFGMLMAGVSISKTMLFFRHIGMTIFAPRTFFYHQTRFLIPAILRHWEAYRQGLINILKGKNNAVWSGDGRYDSMGHSAKYGTYTMFCNTIAKLVHFELLQSNQSGSSSAMELDGAKRSFSFLSAAGLKVTTFISDRHKGIDKWIREEQKDTTHYYDLWHVCKSLVKDLRKAWKEKGCEVIKDWMKSIKKHLYWCALSTSQGFGELIVAKWKSIVRHVADKHDGHPDQSFPTCAHGQLEQERKWIYSGSKAHDKLSAILLKKARLADIKRLSSEGQTSCLEGFHSTLNHWHPKMTHYSWLGSFCRHILAVLHFNENLKRQPQLTKDGKTYYKVTYPKYKLGEEVVKQVSTPPTYEYVSDIKNVMLNTPKEKLKETREKYSKLVPAPLCSQFTEKRSRAAAIQRHEDRNQARTQLYPPEQEQDNMRSQLEAEAEASTTSGGSNAKKTRACRKCKKPMKGHPRGACPST